MKESATIVGLILLARLAVSAQDSLVCRLVGICDTPGNACGVAVEDSFAYVADLESGLRIINVGDPQSPYEAGYLNTPGRAMRLVISGSYAYVADWTAGLRVVDVSNPASPFEVGFWDTPGDANGVAVAGARGLGMFEQAARHRPSRSHGTY